VFSNCKLLGVNFSECNDFLLSLGFEDCQLNMTSFFKLKLKSIKFINCTLRESDFGSADLSAALFERCDLHKAIFDGTNLEKADLSSSSNYVIDPERNRIRNAVFGMHGLPGLLLKYNIKIK